MQKQGVNSLKEQCHTSKRPTHLNVLQAAANGETYVRGITAVDVGRVKRVWKG